MKKIMYLVFLTSICATSQIDIKNFRVTANSAATYTFSDRFDFRFDIKGTYDQLDLFMYYGSENSNNLIGLIYWNRDRDNPLSFPSYTEKNTWFNVSHRFSGRTITIPGKKFILVIKYNGQEKRLTYQAALPDFDNDGIPDIYDNCRFVFNPSQSDVDYNGIGDACEQPDSDRDGINDFRDNCPWVYNPFQIDSDGDGIGNACDFNRSGGDLTMSKNLGASHTVEIYTIDGSLFTRQKVDNTQKEKDLINSLPKGFYIIKNGDKTYKIVK